MRPVEILLFAGHATRCRAVSNVLEQRRCRSWIGGATRDDDDPITHPCSPTHRSS